MPKRPPPVRRSYPCPRCPTTSARSTTHYGSPRVNDRVLTLARAELSPDARTVRLSVPDLAPTDAIEIAYRLRDTAGREVERVIAGTLHRVPASTANWPVLAYAQAAKMGIA